MTFHDNDIALISKYLDGELTPEELRQLESRLTEDAEFASLCAECSLTHRQVTELLKEDQLHEILDQAISTSPSIPRDMMTRARAVGRSGDGADGDSLLSLLRPWSPFRDSMWMWVAASLLVVVASVFLFAPEQVTETASTTTDPDTTTLRPIWSVVATLTRLQDCEWAEGATQFRTGDHLNVDSCIHLESGLAKVTFECGADVVLEGPCNFIIETPMLAYLESGSVSASVPRRAFSFAIRTPGVDFVDLGTDFGISVDEQGGSELHVFQGEVIYRQDAQDRKSSDVVHVVGDEAVILDSNRDHATSIDLNRLKFSSHFELRGGTDEEVLLPVQNDLCLWLSAEYGVDLDENGNVSSWHDRTIGDNTLGEDAHQSNLSERPKLIASAINGNAALRFDGKDDYLLTTPIETTDNQTVFLICQYSPDAFSEDRIYGGQILNYDGPPTREQIESYELPQGISVLQIGEPLLKEEFQPSLVSAQVFAGFRGRTTVEAGRVDSRPVGPEVPIIVTYRYDHENRKANLYVNGHSYGEAIAFAPAGLTSRKIIGRHAWMQLFFRGDLAELLIFNRALGEDETGAMTEYLSEKYAIPISKEKGEAADILN